MSKPPLSHDALQAMLLDRKHDLVTLDEAAWSFLKRLEWPLTHYDQETFWAVRQEGNAAARSVSDPTAMLRLLEQAHPSVRMKLETGDRNASVLILIGGYGTGVTGEFKGNFTFAELGRAVAVAGISAHYSACRLIARQQAVSGISENQHSMKNWPIEELQPGVYYPVNHELRLASHGARTPEKALEMISMNHKGVHGLMLCRERYEKIQSLRSDLSDSPSI